MRIVVQHNIDSIIANLTGQQRQVAYATAVALTRTAATIKAAMPAELDRVFDRPTPFTKRGIYLKAARRDSLTAEVGFMTRQASYLRIQTEGGTRQPTARGIRLPGNVELNAFGNIPRGLTDKLKAAAKDGTLGAAVMRRLGVAAKDRRKGAAHISLFYGKPAGSRWDKAPVGIYRRVPGKPMPYRRQRHRRQQETVPASGMPCYGQLPGHAVKFLSLAVFLRSCIRGWR